MPQFAVCGIEVNVGTLLVRDGVSTWTIASFLIDVNFQKPLRAGLQELLSDHNWYTLRAIAYADNQALDSQSTKAQAVDYVGDLFANSATARRALSNLPDNAHEALQTLLACGGELPAHRFLDQLDPVRPYRPWHNGSLRAPWRNPVSPTEHLWFLGLIYFLPIGLDNMATIPDSLLGLLSSVGPERQRCKLTLSLDIWKDTLDRPQQVTGNGCIKVESNMLSIHPVGVSIYIPEGI